MKAFPVDLLNETTGKVCAQEQGMDLRDYFAAKAMQGILCNPSLYFDTGVTDIRAYEVVLDSYKIADAMVEARKQDNK